MFCLAGVNCTLVFVCYLYESSGVLTQPCQGGTIWYICCVIINLDLAFTLKDKRLKTVSKKDGQGDGQSMSIAAFSLRRPYTVFALIALVCLLAAGAARRMPTDIFPEINIPVVSVVWTYNGMSATDIQNRILTFHERQMASLVDDISRIEANSYNGVGVIKVYLHEGADVSRAISQLASSALVVLKYMPRNITPPLVLRYGATDVPIIQMSLASNTLTDTKLNDLGQNIIRPRLAVVRGASVPYPYGGKPRVIMVGLDQEALQARGLTPDDVSQALSQPERHHAFRRREDG